MIRTWHYLVEWVDLMICAYAKIAKHKNFLMKEKTIQFFKLEEIVPVLIEEVDEFHDER